MGDPLLRLARRFSTNDPATLHEALLAMPNFQGDLTWLERLLDAAEFMSFPEVPGHVSAALHDLMPTTEQRTVETMTAIHDSRSDRVLVGARSDNHVAGDGWTVALSAASADVLFDGIPTGHGTAMVSGHVLCRDGSRQPFTVRAIGLVETAARTTDLGTFELGELPIGDYNFSAGNEDLTLRWTTRVSI